MRDHACAAEWQVELEEAMRDRIMSRRWPIGIIWFFPSGRFALWSLAAAGLACLLTTMPHPGTTDALVIGGVPLRLSAWDVGLLLYAGGWTLAEVRPGPSLRPLPCLASSARCHIWPGSAGARSRQ